jgi:hypothetical protein
MESSTTSSSRRSSNTVNIESKSIRKAPAPVVLLTTLDLTEMKAMQIALAIFRFVSLITVVITSVAALYSYPNSDPAAHSAPTKPYYSDMPAFNWSGHGLMFPISIYEQIFHHTRWHTGKIRKFGFMIFFFY